MIASLRGKLVYKFKNEIILDVNGVGYRIYISKMVSESVNQIDTEYSVITYLDVKENSLQLFGFVDEKEKEMFKLLLSVSGIGTKNAHTILSYVSFKELISFISDSSRISGIKIPGIGAKKLEMISMTLKDKIYRIDSGIDVKESAEGIKGGSEFVRFEALNALMNLGYPRNDAEKIIREVLVSNEPEKVLKTEDIIRKALEYISK